MIMGCVSLVNAQNYVTIPDTNFVKFLQTNFPTAMKGNQMDTTDLSIKNVRKLKITRQLRISHLIWGIQYFTNLDTLDCSNMGINTMSKLPPNLKYLNCSKNDLIGIALPDKLEYLDASNNRLGYILGVEVIKKLPPSLTYVNLSNNRYLHELPNLPDSLESLIIGGNNYYTKTLPTLPPRLKVLSCYNFGLVKLPALPESLTYLDFFGNSIKSISNIPKNLTYLNCGGNQLLNLPNLPENLSYLNCSVNQLTTLPDLPKTLIYLNCSSNKLTLLPNIPDNVVYLNFGNYLIENIYIPPYNTYHPYDGNQLTSFPILPINLDTLICNGIKINSLPKLPTELKYLSCSYNFLTSLPTLPLNLTYLDCNNNKINCFQTFSSNIKSINISENPFKCLPNYISVMDTSISKYPICNDNDPVNNQFFCSNGKIGIEGIAYLDSNINCIKDTNETGLNNIKIELFDSTNKLFYNTFTSNTGNFQFPIQTGKYRVLIDSTNLPFNIFCPKSGDTIVDLKNSDQSKADVNFSLRCKDGFDVGIRSIKTQGIVFPGQQHTLSITAGDMSNWFGGNCANGISGQLKVIVSGPVEKIDIINGAKNPTINGNIFTYDIEDFGNINFNNDFGIIFQTNTTAQAGQQVCIHAQITPKNGDYNPTNNELDFCYSVVNSHDPNLKEVSPEYFKPGYEGYFTYTIHFQNTGNAPAFNIRLLDTLSSKFDLTTFEVLNYSHANRVSLNGNIMNVYFKNIHLMDSTTDEKASHGFIQYRIKPLEPVSEADEIKNTAHIYFDFNEAVVTNTTLSKANKSLSGLTQIKTANFVVYPNPARNHVTLENITTTSRSTNVTVTDLQGKVVYTSTTNFEGKHAIDVSNFNNGVYFIKVENDAYTESVRFIKQ